MRENPLPNLACSSIQTASEPKTLRNGEEKEWLLYTKNSVGTSWPKAEETPFQPIIIIVMANIPSVKKNCSIAENQ